MTASSLTPSALRAIVTIRNRRGLHARAAAKFVRLAGEYDAQVEVVRGDARLEELGPKVLTFVAGYVEAAVGAVYVRAPGGERVGYIGQRSGGMGA